jgi:hypothetical protein
MNTIIEQQPQSVQTLCDQFSQSYAKNRKLVSSWGKMLSEIRDGLTVPTDFAENDDPRATTFSAICRELGILRSSAYHYISIFLIASTYPQWLQDAATENRVNLALEHVQNAYEKIRESLPKEPNSLEISGVVAELKKAKVSQSNEPHLTKQQRFEKMLSDAVKFAKENELIQNEAPLIAELQAICGKYRITVQIPLKKAPVYSQTVVSQTK